MDHHQFVPSGSIAIAPLLSGNDQAHHHNDNEALLEASMMLQQQQQQHPSQCPENATTTPNDGPSHRPLHLDDSLRVAGDNNPMESSETSSFVDGSRRRQQPPQPPMTQSQPQQSQPQQSQPQLPLLLRLLFGLNGLSLSLLTLPIMYILNTKVAVPLPYLPAYGAIAFLPYSLKPLYAYLCGIWATSTKHRANHHSAETGSHSNDSTIRESSRTNIHHNHHNFRYLTLFRRLLVSNSVVTLLFVLVPNGGVVAMFVVAFCRGLTDSWAEFCLGLTLIDHALLLCSSTTATTTTATAATTPNYETTVSGLQAQAATAGNLGAWLASLVTCGVLVGRRLFFSDSHNDIDNIADSDAPQQLTESLANGLVIGTVLVQLMGVMAVFFWETSSSNSLSRYLGGGIRYEELPGEAPPRFESGDGAPGRESQQHAAQPTESDFLRDDESSNPSYSSLEDLADDEDDDESSSLSEATLSSFRAASNNSKPWSAQTIANWALVVLLQCILVVIALKGPIVEASSHFIWGVLMSTLGLGIILAAIALCCKLGSAAEGNDESGTTFRVGLFLVLKNAIPSPSSILASFFYALFGTNQPLLLQFLSFLGMGVSSLSSWSYTKLFSHRFGSGRPLVGLMAVTTALASLVTLLHVAVYRIYSEDDDGSSSSSSSSKLLLAAMVSKFATTFFDEWAFLPELVLATTSVNVPTTTSTPGPISEPPDPMDNSGEDREVGGNNSALESGVDEREEQQQQQQQRMAVEYGTLVSCIDFGDQLGSLLAAPLVAVWQISRENGFLHLDRLIVVCAVANVAVTILLLPLLWWNPKHKG